MLDDASKQRVKDLCDLIAKEQDQKPFSELNPELNQLLDGFQPGAEKDGRPDLASSKEKLT